MSEMMTMVIPNIDTKLPDGSTAFVFGSFLYRTRPSDFDLLILYDSETCPSRDAYRIHEPFLTEAWRTLGTPIDVTLLTYEEEQSIHFVESSGAIPLTTAIESDDRLRQRS